MDEVIQSFHINLEETRQAILIRYRKYGIQSQEEVQHIQQAVEGVYHSVQHLWDAIPLPTSTTTGGSALSSESDAFDVHTIMVESCVGKATILMNELWDLVTRPPKTKGRAVAILDFGTESQASIARVLELTLRLTLESIAVELKHGTLQSQGEEEKTYTLTQMYTAYQRQLLRSRSKPSIAHVAEIRKLATEQQMTVAELVHAAVLNDQGADEHEASNLEGPSDEELEERKRPHATAITVILGEASSLIHPLILWRNGILESQSNWNGHKSSPQLENERNVQSALLEMCHDSIATLHKEAEMLSITVGNWFIADTTHMSTLPSSPNHRETSSEAELNLTMLDATLDQMAFICQVISRFCTFSQQSDVENSIMASLTKATTSTKSQPASTSNTQNLSTHLLEQSLHYSTTETTLTNANLQRALSLAKPVQKIIGSQLYVPSIVEHAYYISKRAMERASGTMSDRAIWTVAHWVCLLWSLEQEHHHGGDVAAGYQEVGSTAVVFSALMSQRGCVVEDSILQESKPLNKEEQKKSSNNFRDALLDAFDQDLVTDGDKSMEKKSKPPSSGSVLSKKNMALVQINSQFCTLNGIHAASSACKDLANFFESLLPEDNEEGEEGQLNNQKGTNMIQFAREELTSHSKSYLNLLKDQTRHVVTEWCGTVQDTKVSPPLIASLPSSPCFHRIYYFFSQENFSIDVSFFHKLETDERLEKALMEPLNNCRIIMDMGGGKCDDQVTSSIAEDFSAHMVSIILGTLLDQQKDFTDWGSILLSKQVRLIEHYLCSLVLKTNPSSNEDEILNLATGNTAAILKHFQKLKQAATILQLESPSEWSMRSYEIGTSAFDLTTEEIRKLMHLRTDFSDTAIQAVFNQA